MDGTVGEIRMFGGTFAPRNWAICEGQLLEISDFTALYSIIGDRFGGNGRTTVGLPDFRGRMPIGIGQGPGLTKRYPGLAGGSEDNTLGLSQLPAHSHQATTATTVTIGNMAVDGSSFSGFIMGTDVTADEPAPDSGRVLAESTVNYFKDGGIPTIPTHPGSVLISGTATVSGAPTATSTTTVYDAGGGNPFSIMPPFLPVYFIMCVDGTYPQRN